MRIIPATNTLIQIAEQNIKYVEGFIYPGSIISKTGGTDEDIKSRIGKAWHVFVTLKPVWNNRKILINTKLTIFNSNVKSVLLYGSETWKHTKALDLNVKRQILRIRWPDTISNEQLWRRTQHIPEVIKERKWRWTGHILRRDPTSITRQALDWNTQGKRRRCRPSTTWKRSLDNELRTYGISWGEAKHKWENEKLSNYSIGMLISS